MAFVNVNRVTLEDADDIIEAMGNAMLLLSSITYDDIKGGDYSHALWQIEGLKHSILNLEHILKRQEIIT